MLIAWGSFKVSKDNGDDDEEKRNNKDNEDKEPSAEMGANSYMIRFITSSKESSIMRKWYAGIYETKKMLQIVYRLLKWFFDDENGKV